MLYYSHRISKVSFTLQEVNTMHEFFTAALPWVALGVAVAIVMTYSGAGRKKEEKKNIEK